MRKQMDRTMRSIIAPVAVCTRCLWSLLMIVFVIMSYRAQAQSGAPPQVQSPPQEKSASVITPQMQAAEEARRLKMSPDELAWEKTLEANLGNFYLPAYYKDKDAGHETAWDYVSDDPKLPRLLILGDSISRGYTLAVRHALAGKVNVHRAPANCGGTAEGLKNLNIWLGDGKWDMITWNFGIHDRNTDPAILKQNIETILASLQKTGAQVLWIRTTPAPPGDNSENFTSVECDRVNEIADEVMKENHVPEVDLYSLVKPRLAELQLPNNVHFREQGYQIMGEEIATAVLSLVEKQRDGTTFLQGHGR